MVQGNYVIIVNILIRKKKKKINITIILYNNKIIDNT